MEIIQQLQHYGLHILAPGLIAWLFFRSQWKRAWLIMILTMLVDLDHLLSNPIFHPDRCSIGFHPLHSAIAIAVYAGMSVLRETRIIGVGLLFHMLTDFLDCLWIID